MRHRRISAAEIVIEPASLRYRDDDGQRDQRSSNYQCDY
jgi:hypothetical protein